MQAKNLKIVAEIIADLDDEDIRRHVAEHFARALSKLNPKFKPHLWEKACRTINPAIGILRKGRCRNSRCDRKNRTRKRWEEIVSELIDGFRSNCTLVAVREASRLADEAILAAFRKNGYKNHKGMKNTKWTQAARDLGLELQEVRPARPNGKEGGFYQSTRGGWWMTLKMFCETYKVGTYLVSVHAHALTVRDGVVIDPNMKRTGLRRKVRAAFLVVNAPHVPKVGRIKLMVHPVRARRQGTRAGRVFLEMYNYVKTHPEATKEDLFRDTSYELKDWKWDIARSNIMIV